MTPYRAHGTGSLQLIRRGVWRSQLEFRTLGARHDCGHDAWTGK